MFNYFVTEGVKEGSMFLRCVVYNRVREDLNLLGPKAVYEHPHGNIFDGNRKHVRQGRRNTTS